MIKIIIADDHHLIRDGLKSTLIDEPDLQIIAEAADGKEALLKTRELKPDILITDITMPFLNGIELTRIICQDKLPTKVLILSMHDSEDYINQALEAGSSGYLLKDSSKEEFLKAIRAINKGEIYCSGDVSKILLNKYLFTSKSKKLKIDAEEKLELTEREIEILRFISEGLSNKEIANNLFLSTRTIDTHRYNLMHKLNVKNTAQLVSLAYKLKLINPKT